MKRLVEIRFMVKVAANDHEHKGAPLPCRRSPLRGCGDGWSNLLTLILILDARGVHSHPASE